MSHDSGIYAKDYLSLSPDVIGQWKQWGRSRLPQANQWGFIILCEMALRAERAERELERVRSDSASLVEGTEQALMRIADDFRKYMQGLDRPSPPDNAVSE